MSLPTPPAPSMQALAAIRELGAIPIMDIIGPGEIRKMAGGVSRKTLMQWRQRPDFPVPVRTLEIGDLFDREQVQAWLEEHR